MGLDMYLYKVRKGDDKRPKLRLNDDLDAEVVFPDGHVEQLDHGYDRDEPGGDLVWRFFKPGTEERVDVSDYADYSFNEWLYWRKFNALHAWFVEHYDGKEDDCEPHSVSVGDMLELTKVLEQVMTYKKYLKPVEGIENNEDGYWKEITDDEICEELDNLLQPQSGFFFGSTDYDTCYFNNVERTLNALKEAEPDMKSGEIEKFIYQASW